MNTYRMGEALQEQYKEHWKGHPRYPKVTWQQHVAKGYTLLGYWQWVVIRQHEDGVP